MTITIPELAPGMNALMRMHFRTYGALRNKWQTLLRSAAGTTRFDCPCEVRIVRYYAANPMDLDNLWSTSKIPLDALVRAKILRNDDPKAVTSLAVEQYKVPTKNRERTEIHILEQPTRTAA